MRFLRLLAKTEIRATLAVLLVSAATGVVFFLDSVITAPQGFLPPYNWSILAAAYAIVLGLPVALVVGGPTYAFLVYKNVASWPTVVALGVLPGLIVLLIDSLDGLAPWFIGCGTAVACLTHILTMKDRVL